MGKSYWVTAEMGGERLDKALALLAPAWSRRALRELIQRGAVYLDGKRCRQASRPVLAGAQIRLEESVVGQASDGGKVEILWRGEALLAVGKPSGVPLVPTISAVEGCIFHALALQEGLPLTSLRAVHRLDAAVSGVAIVALTKGSAAFLGGALQRGEVEKRYLAWVLGTPSHLEGEWSWALDAPRGGIVLASEGGRPARTSYSLKETSGGASLLELSPMTGRTHQLRVHCARAGCPILGDAKYGVRRPGLKRILLHAWKVRFPLPGGSFQEVECSPPPDFRWKE